MPKSTIYNVSRRQFAAFVIVGSILVVANLLLMQQNNSLKAYTANANRGLEAQPGSLLPAIHGKDLDGNQISIEYGKESRDTVVLVFSPACGSCRENVPFWESLVKKLDKNAYRVIAASLARDGAKDFIIRSHLNNLPVIADLDAGDRVAYSLVLTPQVILVDSAGAVKKVWTGVLKGDKKADLEATLNVR